MPALIDPDEHSGVEGEEYEWLRQQLHAAGVDLDQLMLAQQHGEVGEGSDDESDIWQDPSGGVLPQLFAACEEGDAPQLVACLEQLQGVAGVTVNTPGPDGDTALHLAALYGQPVCCEALLAAGAEPGAVNAEDGTTPLHDAAASGELEIVQLLLEHIKPEALQGVLDQADEDGDTALHNAARGVHMEVVKLLLSKGAKTSVLNSSQQTPAQETDDDAIRQLLDGQHRLQAVEGAPP